MATKKLIKELDSITTDRRGLGRTGKGGDRKTSPKPTAEITPLPQERRKVSRRRQIDPTTCEREYTDEEIDFMRAMDTYRHTSGRMFPTCSEILEVLRSMGYQKAEPNAVAIADEVACP